MGITLKLYTLEWVHTLTQVETTIAQPSSNMICSEKNSGIGCGVFGSEGTATKSKTMNILMNVQVYDAGL